MPAPQVGEPAPDFELPGTGGRAYRLSEALGSPLVLAFYPGDGTPVCTLQLRSYNDDLGQLTGLGARLWAISPDSVESHERFSQQEGGFRFPMLADVDKEVFRLYGCVGPLGSARRSVFVVDAEGTVRYAHRSRAGLTYRSTEELVEALKTAG